MPARPDKISATIQTYPTTMSTVMPSAAPALIFVVDDDPAVLHSTRFLLEGEGHVVQTFADGPEVLAAFPGRNPAFVLIDHVMPGMDGLEVYGRLRILDAHVPVILITGHPAPAIRSRARAAGVPLFEKPLAFDALLGMIAAHKVAGAGMHRV